MRHPTAALIAALAFVGLALVTGQHWQGALLGAALSGVTGVASVFAVGAVSGRRGGMNGALAVMAAGFLVRVLLVSLGTVAAVKAGLSVPGFVVGFFVPFFALVAIEAAYVHRLGRGATP